MKYLYLLLFIISSIIHLYGSFEDEKKIRNYSKPFILIGILGYYIFRADSISWVVVMAIITSWLGDVLLIPKGVKWFTAGGISFMISHFFFMLAYYPNIDTAKIPFIVIVLASCIYLFFTWKVFKALKPYLPKVLFYPMILYLLINSSNNICAWMQFLSNISVPTFIVLIGAVCFFISDGTLFLVRFHAKDVVPHRHFYVMLTYIIAEFLIVYGLIIM